METDTSNLRLARMEFKTTADMKALLSRAAALDGLDLTSFVLGPAIEKARQVLVAHAHIAVAAEGQAALAAALRAPQAPTGAMKDLMTLAELPLREAGTSTDKS